MEREEKPLKEWIEAAQLTLCRSRVVIGQPTKVKGEGLNKNFMVERNSEADDDDDDTVDRQVARRFSEFEELGRRARRFGAHGMLVPSLPPKKGFGTGDKVVRRRVRALALFCAAILENCFLAEDSAWVAFVTPGPFGGGSTAALSFGMLRWNECLADAQARGAGGGDAHALGKRAELDDLDDALRAARAPTTASPRPWARRRRRRRPCARRRRGGEAAARPGLAEARDLAQVHEAREKHARDFRCGLVAWSLPKFADRRSRVLNVFAAHVELAAGLLGAPAPPDAVARVQPPGAYRLPPDPRPPPPPAGIEERKSIDEGRGRKSENEVAV
ncbi:hypothetical protein JL722_1762 [Aureococcus anophagefferens]|nr:hypothetical protein JL722_1762 [Aureococcus anophagefferens]